MKDVCTKTTTYKGDSLRSPRLLLLAARKLISNMICARHSLVEGGGRTWCFYAADCIQDGFEVVKRVDSRTEGLELPLCKDFGPGRLKVVYGPGAVTRTDVEIDLDER